MEDNADVVVVPGVTNALLRTSDAQQMTRGEVLYGGEVDGHCDLVVPAAARLSR